MATGVNVSKSVSFAVTGPFLGVDISKSVVYVVTSAAPTGVNISKTVAFIVVKDDTLLQDNKVYCQVIG